MVKSSLDSSLSRGNTQEIATWGKPNYQATYGISFPFTCPANGFGMVQMWSSKNDNFVYVNGIMVALLGISGYAVQIKDIIPVKKGDVITASGSNVVGFFTPDFS